MSSLSSLYTEDNELIRAAWLSLLTGLQHLFPPKIWKLKQAENLPCVIFKPTVEENASR